MKYISPGGWFSLEYPATWSEFEDTEESFLFYNPNKWSGNFRISAYKDASCDYAKQCIAYELTNNPTSIVTTIGKWDCAYSAETFQEEGNWYTTHIWVTGKGNISFECTFTVTKGGERTKAEEIIRTLEIRSGREEKEIIPIRVLEIGEVNTAFEWTSNLIKKYFTKDFTPQETDIEKIQKLIESGKIQSKQREAWENLGLTFGTILENEMDGMIWVSVIDGRNEYAALQFEDLIIEPASLIWDKVKQGQICNLKSEFERIKAEVEKKLQ